MKSYTLLILLSARVSFEVSAQQAEYNSGSNWIHPSNLKLTGVNFINTTTGTLMNNSTIWYIGNFQNDRKIDYDNTLTPYSGLSRFQGISVQTLSGSRTSSFYNVLFSGVSFSLQQNITIANQIDFDNGIITVQQTTLATTMNTVQMLTCSSWLNASVNASAASYEDG